MGRIITTTVYCPNRQGGRYRATFEEKELGEWYGVRADKLAPLTAAERQALRNQTTKKEGGLLSFLSRLSAKKPETLDVRGNFYSGELVCPECGCTAFVKCGNCNQLSCYDGGDTYTCAACGASGRVEGHIENLSGDADDYRPSGGRHIDKR